MAESQFIARDRSCRREYDSRQESDVNGLRDQSSSRAHEAFLLNSSTSFRQNDFLKHKIQQNLMGGN